MEETAAVRLWNNQARADMLVGQLESAYGELPEELRTLILKTNDKERLLRWSKLLLKASSLKQFRKEAGL